MRVLVLGADGMLGHRMARVLAETDAVLGSVRSAPPAAWARLCPGVELAVGEEVQALLDRFAPDAVVNCVGLVKQRPGDEALFEEVNARLPHRLAGLCAPARFVHFSTDCVFSGRRGGYRIEDPPDATDAYGRSKLAGEVDLPHALTLRTSLIGWELKNRHGLLEWFAGNRGRTVKGFRRAVFSGLSTETAARLVAAVLHRHPDLRGVWHVAADPVDKFTLLSDLRDALGWTDTRLTPDDEFVCDRSLDGTPFRAATGWTAPSWRETVHGLAAQRPDYEG